MVLQPTGADNYTCDGARIVVEEVVDVAEPVAVRGDDDRAFGLPDVVLRQVTLRPPARRIDRRNLEEAVGAGVAPTRDRRVRIEERARVPAGERHPGVAELIRIPLVILPPVEVGQ